MIILLSLGAVEAAVLISLVEAVAVRVVLEPAQDSLLRVVLITPLPLAVAVQVVCLQLEVQALIPYLAPLLLLEVGLVLPIMIPVVMVALAAVELAHQR